MSLMPPPLPITRYPEWIAVLAPPRAKARARGAYDRGWQAAYDGRHRLTNPYQDVRTGWTRPLRRAWDDGHDAFTTAAAAAAETTR